MRWLLAEMLQTYAPDLHAYYKGVLDAVERQLPHLKPHFDDNAFSGVTFNVGPRVVTYRHRDHLNLPFGLCCVTALGDFDHKRGGHLVLWDLKLIIQAPQARRTLYPPRC